MEHIYIQPDMFKPESEVGPGVATVQWHLHIYTIYTAIPPV